MRWWSVSRFNYEVVISVNKGHGPSRCKQCARGDPPRTHTRRPEDGSADGRRRTSPRCVRRPFTCMSRLAHHRLASLGAWYVCVRVDGVNQGVAPSICLARVVQQTCLCTFACRVLPSGYSHGLLVHLIQLVTRSIVQRGVIMHCPAFHWLLRCMQCRDREHVLFHAPVGIACTACVCPFCHDGACNDAPVNDQSKRASLLTHSLSCMHESTCSDCRPVLPCA